MGDDYPTLDAPPSVHWVHAAKKLEGYVAHLKAMPIPNPQAILDMQERVDHAYAEAVRWRIKEARDGGSSQD